MLVLNHSLYYSIQILTKEILLKYDSDVIEFNLRYNGSS